MAQEMAVGHTRRQGLAASVLPAEEWGKYLNQSSDLAGFSQLFFHGGCAALAAYAVHCSLQAGSTFGLVASEVMLGFVSSFYFMGFHELIHNTAFQTKWINGLLAHVVGFLVFRGSNWFWCFHWLHHRYTQDPERDPELSGGSADLTDPSRSVLQYVRFLTGWPFGFERSFGMVKMALGLRVDPWVVEAGMEKTVRIEAGVYATIYAMFVCGAVLDERIRAFVIWYWLLPHMLGAGHLRYYQFAEHRACETGSYTDLDAWGAARTTHTFWLYRRLAWNMPFHIEHHAWPAIPFHLLPDVHERIKDTQPKSRCLITGEMGYLAIHIDFVRRVMLGEPTGLPPVEPQPQETTPATVTASKNRLMDTLAMEKLPTFTLAEVAKHKTKADCWVSIQDIVIDATSFLAEHPGGEMIITSKAGTDATKMFKMIHPDRTLENHLPDACIVGVLSGPRAGNLSEPLLKQAP